MSVQAPLFADADSSMSSKLRSGVDDVVTSGIGLEKLVENFEVLSEAAGGVEALRWLLLELAIRGRVVPQQASEGSAAAALLTAREHEAALVLKGRLRRRPPTAPVGPDEQPFDIPPSWRWTRFGALGDWGAGATPSRSNPRYYGGTTPWFKSGELNDGYVDTSEEFVTELALEDCSLRLNQPGDVLIAMYGATIGKVALARKICTTNQAVCACTCHEGVSNEFLLRLLKSFRHRFVNQGAGGAQPNISRAKIVETPCPLPPLAEQKRIVAKVDQLMALCDDLEARQTKKRETRTRLSKAALEALTTADGLEEFVVAWERVVDNFDVLFDRADGIGELRQAILDLLVAGAEPAQVERCSLVDVVAETRYGTARKCDRDRTKTPVLRIPNVVSGKLELEDLKYTDFATDELTDLRLQGGDVLVVRSNGSRDLVGRTCVVDERAEGFAFAGYLIRLRVRPERVHPSWLHLAMQAFQVRQAIEGPARTTSGVHNVNTKELLRLPLRVPPLAAQERIVAKVERLMTFCDDLEAKLRRAEDRAAKLVEAVVHELVSDELHVTITTAARERGASGRASRSRRWPVK